MSGFTLPRTSIISRRTSFIVMTSGPPISNVPESPPGLEACARAFPTSSTNTGCSRCAPEPITGTKGSHRWKATNLFSALSSGP